MQRTLGFARHLPEYGWQPIVLTAAKLAYPAVDSRQLGLIPENLVVKRAVCFDTARHFSLFGRYPGFMAMPDQWASWIPFGIERGLRMIRQYKPTIIWSTYPIASAHVIAYFLSKFSKLPWVADFRDPMVETDPRTGEDFPKNPTIRRARSRIENRCSNSAAALVFCTEGAKRIFCRRNLTIKGACHVVPNGYEEELFQAAERKLAQAKTDNSAPVTILHSGTIYPTPDRDPRPLLEAISQLHTEGFFATRPTRFVFRATGHDHYLRSILTQPGLSDLIRLEPAIPYTDALAEMLSVDGLLLLQGYTSNPAIPAKAYEYLRAGRPILALIDRQGCTADLLRNMETSIIAPMENVSEIKIAVRRIYGVITSKAHLSPSNGDVARFSRARLAAEAAEIFNGV